MAEEGRNGINNNQNGNNLPSQEGPAAFTISPQLKMKTCQRKKEMGTTKGFSRS